MYKSATKCNETIGKWCKNKHGASKIIDTFETYQRARGCPGVVSGVVIGGRLLFLLDHRAVLDIETKQPKLIV
jgi:hypothetical protein